MKKLHFCYNTSKFITLQNHCNDFRRWIFPLLDSPNKYFGYDNEALRLTVWNANAMTTFGTLRQMSLLLSK